MALTIRLRQQGRKNRHTFRVVVVDSRAKRDGAYIESLGWYNPRGMVDASINGERLNHWLEQGAVASEKVMALAARTTPETMEKVRERQHERQEKARLRRKKQRSAA